MKTRISVKVNISNDEPYKATVIVRRIKLGDDGLFLEKHGLNGNGDWIEVGEGERYPDECLLDAEIFEKRHPLLQDR